MPNWELQLVAKVIDNHDLKTAIQEQIRSDTFHTTHARTVWGYIQEIYHTKNKIPSREMVKSVYPRITLPENGTDDLAVICDHVRKGHLSTELQRYALEVGELAPSSPEEAVARLGAAYTALSQSSRAGQDLVLSGELEETRREYLLAKSLRRSKKVLGIAYPWDPMTEESNGMLPGELIMFYGRPKSMKTFVACYMAAYCYNTLHRKVLFYSREMSPTQIKARVLCSIAQVDYTEYRKGMLPEEKESHLFQTMEAFHTHDKEAVTEHGRRKEASFIIATDTRADGGGISSLKAMIDQYEPDVVFVDGVYLMRDDRKGERSRDWKNIANITSDLKLAAQSYGIPIIGNSQANRMSGDKSKGGGLRDLAFSDSIGQDADLIIRVQLTQDDMGSDVINLVVAGSREFALDGIIINAVPCTDFSLIGVMKDNPSAKDLSDTAKEEAQEMAARIKRERGDENKTLGTKPIDTMTTDDRLNRAHKRRLHAQDVEEAPPTIAQDKPVRRRARDRFPT